MPAFQHPGAGEKFIDERESLLRLAAQQYDGIDAMQQAEQFDPEAEDAVAGGKGAILAAALDAMQRALKLDEKSGVKKDIESLDRELKKLASGT